MPSRYRNYYDKLFLLQRKLTRLIINLLKNEANYIARMALRHCIVYHRLRPVNRARSCGRTTAGNIRDWCKRIIAREKIYIYIKILPEKFQSQIVEIQGGIKFNTRSFIAAKYLRFDEAFKTRTILSRTEMNIHRAITINLSELHRVLLNGEDIYLLARRTSIITETLVPLH